MNLWKLNFWESVGKKRLKYSSRLAMRSPGWCAELWFMRQGGRKRPCKDNEQGLIPSENEQNLHFALAHNLRVSRFHCSTGILTLPAAVSHLPLTHFQHIKKVQRARRSTQKIFQRRERDTACIDSHSTLFALKHEKGYWVSQSTSYL